MPDERELLSIVFRQNADISPDEMQACGVMSQAAFSAPETDASHEYDPLVGQIEWLDSEEHFFGYLGNQLVTNVGIVARTIRVGSQEYRAAGVGGVATHPDYQKRGFASQVMAAAGKYITSSGKFDFGMLFCSEERVPLYTHCGWTLIHNPVYFALKDQRVAMPAPCMIIARPGLSWPAGEVDTLGKPW